MSKQVHLSVVVTFDGENVNESAIRESIEFWVNDARLAGAITPEDDNDHAMLTNIEVKLLPPTA